MSVLTLNLSLDIFWRYHCLKVEKQFQLQSKSMKQKYLKILAGVAFYISDHQRNKKKKITRSRIFYAVTDKKKKMFQTARVSILRNISDFCASLDFALKANVEKKNIFYEIKSLNSI